MKQTIVKITFDSKNGYCYLTNKGFCWYSKEKQFSENDVVLVEYLYGKTKVSKAS